MNKDLIVWEGSSSYSDESECPGDASMLVIQDEDDEDEVTLLDIKKKLNILSVRRLRKPANILIDSIIELMIEKDSMNNSLDSLYEETYVMSVHMSVIEEQLVPL